MRALDTGSRKGREVAEVIGVQVERAVEGSSMSWCASSCGEGNEAKERIEVWSSQLQGLA